MYDVNVKLSGRIANISAAALASGDLTDPLPAHHIDRIVAGIIGADVAGDGIFGYSNDNTTDDPLFGLGPLHVSTPGLGDTFTDGLLWATHFDTPTITPSGILLRITGYDSTRTVAGLYNPNTTY